jgi:hypothetical protein
MSGWTSADLLERFQLYLGRGNGGVMDADELWTDARAYLWLADAQEAVYADLAPRAPHAFVSAPTLLTSTDGGVTYSFGSAYPFAHVEVYAQESGGRTLLASTYGTIGGDFVIEGATLRSPGNRTRTYSSGPWARFTAFPARLSASQEPSMQPPPARELILWKALENATEVSTGAMDPTPWQEKYAAALRRWLTVWQTQYQSAGNAAFMASGGPWWLGLDAMNGDA